MVLDLLYLPILNEDVIGWVDSITFQVTSMMSPMPSNMHFIKLKKLKNAEDDNLEWIILWSLQMCKILKDIYN